MVMDPERPSLQYDLSGCKVGSEGGVGTIRLPVLLVVGVGGSRH